jgi:D-xylose transport system substrate-binding protein
MRKRTLYQAGAAVAAAATLAALVLPATVGEAAATPTVKVTQFTNTFHVMTTLTSLAKEGKGKVAAILPTTTSSTRYVEFDQPDLKKAMQKAGLPTSDIIVQNAQGSDTTQLTDAETDITNGATVLLVDPLDSGVGGKIESYAKSHGVKVIDYDRLTLGGSRAYYVSFNNVQVGQLIGKGPCENYLRVVRRRALARLGVMV